MTFGTQVAQSHRISPSKDSIHHKNKSKKGPRFRHDRSIKVKSVQESPSVALDSGLTTSVNIPRRRRSENITDAALIPYAGPKFSSPPHPSVLPKPPSHWINSPIRSLDGDLAAMSQHLRMLLRVES